MLVRTECQTITSWLQLLCSTSWATIHPYIVGEDLPHVELSIPTVGEDHPHVEISIPIVGEDHSHVERSIPIVGDHNPHVELCIPIVGEDHPHVYRIQPYIVGDDHPHVSNFLSWGCRSEATLPPQFYLCNSLQLFKLIKVYLSLLLALCLFFHM